MKNTNEQKQTTLSGTAGLDSFPYAKDVLSYNTGEHIFKQGDLNEGIFIVLSGKVKLYKVNGDKDFPLEVVNKNGIIGIGIRQDTNTYFSSAVAEEPVCVIRVEDYRLAKVLSSRPEISIEYIKLLSGRIRNIESKTADLVFKKSNVRLARYLLERYHNESENPRGLNIPLAELANAVCVSNSYLIKLMAMFKKRGMIRYRKNRIKIIDPEKLIEEAGRKPKRA